MARETRSSGSVFKSFLALALSLAAAGCAGDRLGVRAEGDDIRFVLQPAPGTRTVILVLLPEGGPALEVPLRPLEGRKGDWEVVLPLDEANYRYFFRVDGRITNDPLRLRSAADDFGGLNGLFTIRRVPDRGVSIY